MTEHNKWDHYRFTLKFRKTRRNKVLLFGKLRNPVEAFMFYESSYGIKEQLIGNEPQVVSFIRLPGRLTRWPKPIRKNLLKETV